MRYSITNGAALVTETNIELEHVICHSVSKWTVHGREQLCVLCKAVALIVRCVLITTVSVRTKRNTTDSGRNCTGSDSGRNICGFSRMYTDNVNSQFFRGLQRSPT